MRLWFSYFTAEKLGWWVLIILIVIVAVIAIVFAILAFGESQVAKPGRNIVRHDVVAKGDLVVNGDSRMEAVDAESLIIHKDLIGNKIKTSVLRLNNVLIINDTGTTTIQLTGNNSAYRVDSLSAIINLILPPISEVPGQLFQISKSQTGANSTVNIHISSSDFLCDNTGCQPGVINPLLTLLPNQADQVWITNDFISSWKPI